MGKGLLFENCSCQLLCPAHVSFKQQCDHNACVGHWAVHVASGRFGETVIDDLNFAIVFESPVRMYEGDWTQRIYVDDRATPRQHAALETILSGAAGGPWEVLGQFVASRLDTKAVSMTFEDAGPVKRMSVPGIFETEVSAIRGRNGDGPPTLSNLYNVIHGLVHTLARGRTMCRDAPFDFAVDGTHGLYSHFSWTGGRSCRCTAQSGAAPGRQRGYHPV